MSDEHAGRDDTLRQLEQEVGVLIRRVKRVIGDRARAVHADLQPGSYLVLTYIAEHGPVRATDVVDLLAIDKGAVSRQITHLLDLGLLDREKDPDDGRAHRLSVSDEGRSRLADVTEHRRKRFGEQLSGWTDDDLARFADDLARYNAALGDRS